jgi:hypothetical protein
MNEIASTLPAAPAASGRRGTVRFLRHFLEMTAAMIAGMLLLGPVWSAATAGIALFDRADVGALVMATNMTIGMTVWMRHRGHRWAPVAEMGAAMYVPFLLLAGPYWAGALSADGLMMGGHMLMAPAMVAAMLLRREEYTAAHHTRPARRVRHPLVGALARRWPTWLALLVTFDNWLSPTVPSPWALLVLPAGYLLIGAWRRRLGDRRVLALQLAGLAAYLGLAVVAASVDAGLARYVIGGAWISHSVWDLAHLRANAVVPRGYAEWCAVVDAVIGVTIIALL